MTCWVCNGPLPPQSPRGGRRFRYCCAAHRQKAKRVRAILATLDSTCPPAESQLQGESP